MFCEFYQDSSRYDKYKKGTILNAFKRELSNRSLIDIGVYCLAPIINLFSPPNSIKCNAFLLNTGVDGQGSAILDYWTMDTVVIYSKIANSYIPYKIQGENGSIIIDKINNFENVKIIYRDGSVEDIGVKHSENNMYYKI